MRTLRTFEKRVIQLPVPGSHGAPELRLLRTFLHFCDGDASLVVKPYLQGAPDNTKTPCRIHSCQIQILISLVAWTSTVFKISQITHKEYRKHYRVIIWFISLVLYSRIFHLCSIMGWEKPGSAPGNQDSRCSQLQLERCPALAGPQLSQKWSIYETKDN